MTSKTERDKSIASDLRIRKPGGFVDGLSAVFAYILKQVRSFSVTLKLASANVFRHKIRTFFTSLGIFIAVVLVSIILFAMQGIKTALVEEFTRTFAPDEVLVVYMGDASKTPIKKDLLDEIQAMDHVRDVDVSIRVRGFVEFPFLDKKDTYRPVYAVLLGKDPKGFAMKYRLRESLSEDIVESLQPGQVFVGDALVKSFNNLNETNLHVEDLKGKSIEYYVQNLGFSGGMLLGANHTKSTKGVSKTRAGSESFKSVPKFILKVLDVYEIGEDPDMPWLYVHLETAKRMYLKSIGKPVTDENLRKFSERFGYTNVRIKVDSAEYAEQVAEEIMDKYGKKGITAMSVKQLLGFMLSMVDFLGFAVLLISVVSGIIAALGIINTVIMSVYEQRRQIGILKAIGASNFQIFWIYLWQGIFIGILGAAVGLGATIALTRALDPIVASMLKQVGFSVSSFFVVDLATVLWIALASVAIGAVAGLWPALKAASTDPVKAIRG